MEIKDCKRCGESWCYYGTGRPVRCGKCKSPYWDRERKEFPVEKPQMDTTKRIEPKPVTVDQDDEPHELTYGPLED